MIQFNMKYISKIKMPGYYESLSVFTSRGMLSLRKQRPCFTKNVVHKSLFGQSKSFSSYGEVRCNKSSSKSTYVKPLFDDDDDDDKLNSDLPGSTNTIEGFKAVCSKQEQFLINQLQIEMKRIDSLKNEDWDQLRNLVLNMTGTINEKSVDAVILNKCSELKLLTLGKLYYKYLKSTHKPINRAIYGNYLRLFFCCKNDCTHDDLREISVVYKELLEVYPLLDSYTAEKAICALSLTHQWKEFEKLFVAIKQFYNPSTYVYRIIIYTAFDHQEFDLGWKLIEEMQYQGQNVPDEIFLCWFDKIKFRKLDEDLTRVLKFYNYFNIKPSSDVCKGISEAFQMNNKERKVTLTRIARSGECRSCHSKLEPSYVSEEDYNELKTAFLNPVIIGKDIFQKTKPEEFRKFLEFLEEYAPFNVVLDGLNVTFQGASRSVMDLTFRLKSVVKYFVDLNKNVLVLGRKHMSKWRSPHMEYVIKNAHLFLTDDISQDDPFMLYATLYSGLGSCFVSRDMMRGHKFLLANPKLQITFHKWQAQHQYFISSIGKNGSVYFQEPVSFLQTIQQNSKGDWHIPFFVRGEDLTTKDRVDHLHRHWLCLQNKPAVVTQRNVPKEPIIKQQKTWETGRPIKKTTGISIKKLLEDDGR